MTNGTYPAAPRVILFQVLWPYWNIHLIWTGRYTEPVRLRCVNAMSLNSNLIQNKSRNGFQHSLRKAIIILILARGRGKNGGRTGGIPRHCTKKSRYARRCITPAFGPPTRICQSRTPNPRIVGCGGKIHWAYPCLRLSLRHCLLNLRLQRT